MAEAGLNIIWLLVIATSGLIYAFLLDKEGTHPWLVWSLLTVGALRALWTLPRGPPPRTRPSPGWTAALDIPATLAFVYATGGYRSPFFIAMYVAAVGAAMRLPLGGTALMTGSLGAGYLGLLAMLGQVAGHEATVSTRITFLFFIAASAALLARERDAQAAQRGWQAREQAQLASQARLLAAVHDAIIATATDPPRFTITAWNRGAEALYGWRAEEVLGRAAPEILRTEYTEEQRTSATRTLLETGRFGGEVVQRHKDGSRLFIEARVIAIRDEEGKPIGYVTINRDISARRQAEEAQQRLFEERTARTAAEKALQARDEFLSIASHELKTPLTALKLQLQALLRPRGGPLPAEELTRRLRLLERQVERLGRLVESLLDVSLLSLGRLRLHREKVDLSALVREALAREEEMATQARTPLHLWARPAVVGYWDPKRLEQVVENLLANALKYGAGRPVEVTVEECAGQALLRVRDHGLGIAPEDQARIFERFERAVSGRNYGGMGLGLWIVRQVVEALQGQVWVESRPGEGAAFTVALPLGGPPPHAREGRRPGSREIPPE